MSMTRAEAIDWFEQVRDIAKRNLGEKWTRGCEKHYQLKVDLAEAALTALRPVSRERVEKVWSPCNFCAGAKYITGGVTAVYPVSETRLQETFAEGDFDFCPACGRPLTDEAVQMVMERLEALHGE